MGCICVNKGKKKINYKELVQGITVFAKLPDPQVESAGGRPRRLDGIVHLKARRLNTHFKSRSREKVDVPV